MRVIDWKGRGYLSEAIKPASIGRLPSFVASPRGWSHFWSTDYDGDHGDGDDHTFDPDYDSDRGDRGDDGDSGSFDANDDRKGFPHQVLEKFGAGCANMNIGASKWNGVRWWGATLGVGLLWEGWGAVEGSMQRGRLYQKMKQFRHERTIKQTLIHGRWAII